MGACNARNLASLNQPGERSLMEMIELQLESVTNGDGDGGGSAWRWRWMKESRGGEKPRES